MPAGLPGSNNADNQGNPNKGQSVLFDPASGPKGSPFDHKVITSWNYATGMPVLGVGSGDSVLSTGALSTGIGFGLNTEVPGGVDGVVGTGTTPVDLDSTGNFSSQYIPGTSLPSLAAAADARLLYIGGGKSDVAGVSTPRAVSQLCAAGGGRYLPSVVAGASRDGGTNQGFGTKLVIATGATAFGAAIVAGFTNRSSIGDDFTGEQAQLSLASAQAQFGSAGTAAPVPS